MLRGRQPRSAVDPKRTSYEARQTPLDRQVGQGNFKIYDEPVSLPAPFELAAKIPDAAELCGRREVPILEIARSRNFTLEKLKEALKRSAEIH